jgi:hypothetical protein
VKSHCVNGHEIAVVGRYPNRTCKACARDYNSRHTVEEDRAYQLRRKFGMTVAEYDAMLVRQCGRCALCGKEPNGKALAVDHCHTTGVNRGLLCGNCNQGIGKLHDDPDFIRLAATYLDAFV